ncbi:cupin domain-containing protein [Flagellimonas lutimaris]|uniref:Cupin domain-containing protein n=1 Tax=Flagellimonas lutimaris TaxID=475082 RepID=A0A3A1N3S4_9FLAO|nr:cupin domain-containing protein [Allomuricauda lutimaris]RIV30571.1 cupin domain-containing protein [Allomuricauda lutimaris]
MKKNRGNAEHYKWGANCDGWHLLKDDRLSIIEEMMPPNTSEAKHYHTIAQQFFYILKGEAVFELKNGTVRVLEREGIHIEPQTVHQIRNEEKVNLEFLVISEPTSRADRIEME